MSQTKAQLVEGLNINTSAPADSLVIDSSGKVGIGTTSASANLHVNGSNGTILVTGTTNTAGVSLGVREDGQDVQLISNSSGGALRFYTNPSGGVEERARIDSSGRLLVGTPTGRGAGTGVVWPVVIESAGYGALALISNRTDGDGAYLSLGKSRGNAVGSNTVVQSGDTLGQIIWGGADGTDLECRAAAILCQVDGTPGSNDMPGRIIFSTAADGAPNATERLRIDSAGRVMFSKTFNDTTKGCQILPDDANTGRFHAVGDGSGSGAAFYVTNASGTAQYIVRPNGNVLNTNNSYGPISSDERLKQDVVDAGSQWDDIKSVRLTKFHYKNDPTGNLQLGPIAQELEKVCPNLITRRPAAEEEVADPSNDLVDGDEVLSFKASILYMKAVGALQEAMERIETLEAEVAALKAQ